jgi:hypothetical protein
MSSLEDSDEPISDQASILSEEIKQNKKQKILLKQRQTKLVIEILKKDLDQDLVQKKRTRLEIESSEDFTPVKLVPNKSKSVHKFII